MVIFKRVIFLIILNSARTKIKFRVFLLVFNVVINMMYAVTGVKHDHPDKK